MKREYLQENKPLHFEFNQNRYDFIVEELPPGKFSGKGNYLVLKIQKVFNSTWDLIDVISKKLKIPQNLIGYAGLKDKNATTVQYISIPLKSSRDYEALNSKNITVLETYRHHERLKLGDLKGNSFIITLKKVAPKDINTLRQRLSAIEKNGMPNYFGFQRFGKDGNFKKAKAVVYGNEIIRDKALKNFLISAYQSYFFNDWLTQRVKMAKQMKLDRLNLLEGEIMMEYSSGKTFSPKSLNSVIKDYEDGVLAPTGLLPGRRVYRSRDKAGEIESKFDDIYIHEKGSRRAAWIYPKKISHSYNEKEQMLELKFELPKSSYATVLIENLSNKNLRP